VSLSVEVCRRQDWSNFAVNCDKRIFSDPWMTSEHGKWITSNLSPRVESIATRNLPDRQSSGVRSSREALAVRSAWQVHASAIRKGVPNGRHRSTQSEHSSNASQLTPAGA